MKGFPTQKQVERIKEQYPIGTKIKLLSMRDRYAPIESGTIGEITTVDDIGTLFMKWENGRTLGIIPFEDSFEVISKPILSRYDTIAQSQSADFTDQMVILTPEKLKEQYRTSRNQIWVATHGPGISKLNSFTGTVHLAHPIDGDKMAVHRNDIIGIAKPEVVEQYLGQTEQTQTMEMGGMSQ
ncbi:MAG: DUF4314 domain-containing protein [Clostridia bacterium]